MPPHFSRFEIAGDLIARSSERILEFCVWLVESASTISKAVLRIVVLNVPVLDFTTVE
jgi:hypothetical protein